MLSATIKSEDVAFAGLVVAANLPTDALAPVPPFVLPPDYDREAVEALLTRLVADHERLDAYADALVAAYKRQGVWEHMLRTLPLEGDADTLAIAANGFGGLPDDRLAMLAMNPDELHGLAGALQADPALEPGDWYFTALAHAANDFDRRRQGKDQVVSG